MKPGKLLLSLLLILSLCAGVFALADAAVEEFWDYTYDVDKTIYVNASDGLGLYMRYGPGTEYGKVNSQTIPNGTAVRIIQECTAANGWKWGYGSYTFPGETYADSGWICLVETTSKAPASRPAPAQATPERAVDRVLYIAASDGLGLYMRTGPGTDYSKVNSRTIPNGTALHITKEVTAANGWTWGWCSYQFPGQSGTSSGWCCLVETTTAPPTAAQPHQTGPVQQTTPVQQPDPAQQAAPVQQAEPASQTEAAQKTEPAVTAQEPAEETAPSVEPAETEPAETEARDESQTQESKTRAPAAYSSMALVVIGIVVGIVAAAAVLLIVTRRRR